MDERGEEIIIALHDMAGVDSYSAALFHEEYFIFL